MYLLIKTVGTYDETIRSVVMLSSTEEECWVYINKHYVVKDTFTYENVNRYRVGNETELQLICLKENEIYSDLYIV